MFKARLGLALVLLVVALCMGWCLVYAMGVPFLGIPLGLAAYPLVAVFPQFGQTGADVEVGFAWLIVKSQRAFLAFSLYYSTVCYAILLPCGLLAQRMWYRK